MSEKKLQEKTIDNILSNITKKNVKIMIRLHPSKVANFNDIILVFASFLFAQKIKNEKKVSVFVLAQMTDETESYNINEIDTYMPAVIELLDFCSHRTKIKSEIKFQSAILTTNTYRNITNLIKHNISKINKELITKVKCQTKGIINKKISIEQTRELKNVILEIGTASLNQNQDYNFQIINVKQRDAVKYIELEKICKIYKILNIHKMADTLYIPKINLNETEKIEYTYENMIKTKGLLDLETTFNLIKRWFNDPQMFLREYDLKYFTKEFEK